MTGVWKIWSKAPKDAVQPMLQSLGDVFDQWGCMWLWESLKWHGHPGWLCESIRQGDCMVVAVGLYMPDIRTDLCSTVFF